MTNASLFRYRRNSIGPAQILILIVLCVGFVMVAYPLFWVVMSSLKTTEDITLNIWALPTVPQWQNYANAWNRGISGYFVNSLIVTLSTIAGVLALILALRLRPREVQGPLAQIRPHRHHGRHDVESAGLPCPPLRIADGVENQEHLSRPHHPLCGFSGSPSTPSSYALSS